MTGNVPLTLDQTAPKKRRSRSFTFKEPVSEKEIVRLALSILSRRMSRGSLLSGAGDAKCYLSLRLGTLEREVFCCLFLDNRHRVLHFEELFYGTIDGATVHPREIVKRALTHNAAAVILAHNHPSAVAEPSRADEEITRRITDALRLVDIRVIDHIVVGGADAMSFAERGMLP